eukprot:4200382-Amphidinium_carterae.1
MAYGGPAGDPQVTADLNTIRAWQRKLNAGTLDWPLASEVWVGALLRGRGRGPIPLAASGGPTCLGPG